MSEKPLNAKVAEALGWTAFHSKHDYWIVTEPDGTRHNDGFYRENPKYDPETGEKLLPREWWDEVEPPRYDEDWSVTGPLIEKYRIKIDPADHDPGWGVIATLHGARDDFGETPLIAVCNVIVALAAAGKLAPR